MKVGLVSANFGGRDDVVPLPPHPDVDGYYYTDAEVPDPGAWRVTHLPPAGDPRGRSKFYKCQIHRVEGLSDYPWLAWMDATLSPTDLAPLAEMAARLEREGRLAAFFPHPQRATAWDEYHHVITRIRGGDAYLASKTTAAAEEAEWKEMRTRVDLGDTPLWTGGTWLVANDPRVHAMFDEWYSWVNAHTCIDQPSLAALLRLHGIDPVPFAGTVYANGWFVRRRHLLGQTTAARSGRRLLLCCGPVRKQGYVRLDANPAWAPDILATLPPLPESARGPWGRIELIHGIEHFLPWEAEGLLRELHVSLDRGGILVLEQPNVEFAARALLDGKSDQLSWWPLYGDPNHKDPLFLHHWGYTPRSLTALLRKVGAWSSIRQMRTTEHKGLEGRDFRLEAIK